MKAPERLRIALAAARDRRARTVRVPVKALDELLRERDWQAAELVVARAQLEFNEAAARTLVTQIARSATGARHRVETIEDAAA